MATDGDAALTFYVNGLFNPKEEIDWPTLRDSLEEGFDCPAIHFHNPTMAISHGAVVDAVKKNSGLAALASVFAVGAVLVDTMLDTGVTPRVIASAMDQVQGVLQEKAEKVARRLQGEIAKGLERAPHVRHVNLVGHSHGGWCAREFIQLGLAAELAEAHGVDFRVYVLGCPVLVKPGEGVSSLVQLHNAKDVLSLRYEPSVAAREPQVVVASSETYHVMDKYLRWLRRYLSNASALT
mmetsp:Transcript_19840/g.56717  ORF Transcript_19840/g.56717 Transcript_19840/m.56717 type:complete len:238 (+) Transcript_19840:143-856(+)